MHLSSLQPVVDRHRPRLAYAHDGTGPVPLFSPLPEPADGHPAPARPQPDANPNAALRTRIEAARRESLAAFRQRPQMLAVGHSELNQINADLKAVRAVNAALPHQQQSLKLAAWPSPVFRHALYSWRDLFDALDAAQRVLSADAAHRASWLFAHG